MPTEMQVQGMENLLARLNALGQAANRVANQALKEAAEPLADAMRRNVHVSTVEHKHIRDDIQISGVKTRDGAKYVEVGPGKETAWRAKFLEFGTSHSPAYPFVEPSVHETRDEVLRRLRDALERGLGL